MALTGTNRSYSFGHSDDTLSVQIVVSYISALIIANGPQLFLSFCYFSYNTFFTRIAVEQEWYLFSVRYQPLRVSYPVGEQTSNYRLQLPYKYSVPLLVTSILLHWLVSNTIYIFINEGGMSGIYRRKAAVANLAKDIGRIWNRSQARSLVFLQMPSSQLATHRQLSSWFS